MNDIANLKHRLQRQLGEFRAELERMKVKVRQRFSSAEIGTTDQAKHKASAEALVQLDEKLTHVSRTLAKVDERHWVNKRDEVLRLWEELRDDFFAARTRLFPTN